MVFGKKFLAQKISWAILPMMGYQFKIKEPQLQNFIFHGIHSSYIGALYLIMVLQTP